MTLDPKSTLVAVTIVIIVAFALGRYSAPDAEISKTISATTDTQKHVDKDTHEVIEETKKPDGTITTRKTIDINAHTDTKKIEKDITTETVTAKGGKVQVSALAGIDGFRSLTPIYGASFSKEILGPISAGVFGMTNGILGVSIGITF